MGAAHMGLPGVTGDETEGTVELRGCLGGVRVLYEWASLVEGDFDLRVCFGCEQEL